MLLPSGGGLAMAAEALADDVTQPGLKAVGGLRATAPGLKPPLTAPGLKPRATPPAGGGGAA